MLWPYHPSGGSSMPGMNLPGFLPVRLAIESLPKAWQCVLSMIVLVLMIANRLFLSTGLWQTNTLIKWLLYPLPHMRGSGCLPDACDYWSSHPRFGERAVTIHDDHAVVWNIAPFVCLACDSTNLLLSDFFPHACGTQLNKITEQPRCNQFVP